MPLLRLSEKHRHHGIYITLPDRKVQMYDRNFDVYMNAFVRFRTLCETWIDDSDIVVSIENTDGFREYEKSDRVFENIFLISVLCKAFSFEIPDTYL